MATLKRTCSKDIETARAHIGDPRAKAYYEGRGISQETMTAYGCGYYPQWRHPKKPHDPLTDRLIFPTSGGYEARLIYDPPADSETSKVEKVVDKGAQGIGIFNADALRQAAETDRPCWIVEGVMDALSLLQKGALAVGAGGTSGAREISKELGKLDKLPQLIIALDADNAGEEAIKGFKTELDKLGRERLKSGELLFYRVVNLTELAGTSKAKDANDILREAPDSLAMACEEAETATKNEFAELFNEYNDRYQAGGIALRLNNGDARTPHYATGFPELDKALDGGLHPGLYVIGAIPSLGKTTFALQIATNIASRETEEDYRRRLSPEELETEERSRAEEKKAAIAAWGKQLEEWQMVRETALKNNMTPPPRPPKPKTGIDYGQDVLFVSFEMSEYELIAKTQSRLTYEQARKEGKEFSALTARDVLSKHTSEDGILPQAQKELLQKIEKEYIIGDNLGRHLYIHEVQGLMTAEQIKERVNQHIALTGTTPVVIVDYLQIIAPHDDHATERQRVDVALMTLKQMSRDLNTPVVVISSLNRENYKNPLSMESFKDSGGVEYGVDVLIGLQFERVKLSKVFEGNLPPEYGEYDVNEEKARDPREVELVILKNRNGTPFGSVLLDYRAAYNHIEESGRESLTHMKERRAIEDAMKESKKSNGNSEALKNAKANYRRDRH